MYSSKLVLLLLFLIECTEAQDNSTNFIQHPISDTFCEGDNGVLSCVIEDNTASDSANATGWFIDEIAPVLIQPNINPKFIINNTRNGDLVTSVLIIQSLSSSDNGNGYFCSPQFGIRSNTAVLSIIAASTIPPIITDIKPINNETFYVSWNITDRNYTYNHTVTFTNLRDDVMGNITVPGNTNNSMVTGLDGINNYDVTVAATCGMIMSVPKTVYTAPSAPMNVRIRNDSTSESFVVQWDAVMDLFTVNYTVRWYGDDGIDGTATVTGLSYTVTNLTNSTCYNVTVVANNTCCGAGLVSNVTVGKTNNDPPTLPPLSTTTTTTDIATTATTTVTTVSSPTATSTSGESSDNNTGAIVGGIIGGIFAVILVVVIIVVVYFFCCRNKDSVDNDTQGLKSPTGTGGSHTASIKPAANVPHQTAASGEEYAVTTRVTTTKPQQQPPTQEYAVVDKGKKHAAATQGIHYADLQDLPGSGSKPPTNQGPTSTYAMVA